MGWRDTASTPPTTAGDFLGGADEARVSSARYAGIGSGGGGPAVDHLAEGDGTARAASPTARAAINAGHVDGQPMLVDYSPGGAADPAAAHRALAASLIEIGGTASAGDVELLLGALVKAPLAGLLALAAARTRVVVCRNAITEVATELKGKHPRGWPPDKTWDDVRGAHEPHNNRVIIAIVNGHLPNQDEDTGSFSTPLHELAHAIDYAVGRDSEKPAFVEARERDQKFNRLDEYEGQAGRAGLQETYAESFARFYGGDPHDRALYPNLHRYWASNPLDAHRK